MTLPRPPFGIPPGIAITSSRWEEKKFPPGISDGMTTTWPSAPYRNSDPRVYQIKIAGHWAKRNGNAQEDMMYFLDRLPDGYAVFEMDQPGGTQVYKRLFGHPSGRFYDSIVRFETHVWWLLDGKKGQCECFLCGNYKPPPTTVTRKVRVEPTEKPIKVPKPSIRVDGPRNPPQPLRQLNNSIDDDMSSRSDSMSGATNDRSRRPARGTALSHPIDEEGTRDVWKEAMTMIHAARDSKDGREIDITENESIDWRSERESIPLYLTQVEQQHSFIPRIGELVLWCPSFLEECFLSRHPRSGQYQFYDFKSQEFIDQFPQWRGGVVTAVPSRASKNGSIDFNDLLSLPEKKTALNTSGFRIETMPDPNNQDKSLSKQYRYVPLRNIRPLSHWQLILNGIPQKHMHTSILYAMTCMTSVSLVDKWRLNGGWKDGAYISAKGIHLGSELLTIGDAIRIVPETPSTKCTDIMVLEHIRLHLNGLEEEHLDLNSPRICSKSFVTFLGKAYTVDPQRAYVDLHDLPGNVAQPISLESGKSTFRPVGSALYGSWYPLHPSRKRLEVSYEQVLGRVYEGEAIRLWSGQRQQKSKDSSADLSKPDLSFDMTSIIAGRKYATKVERRIHGDPLPDPNEIRWVISDYRAQALDVAIFNNLEVGPYFEARTPSTLVAWRAHIKIANGEKLTSKDLVVGMSPPKRGRPSYRIPTLEKFESSPGQPSGKKRGRPTGSKIIDGKMYRAEEIAQMMATPTKNKQLSTTDEVDEAEEMTDEAEEDELIEPAEISETQVPHKHSSQMAGAALISSDEDEFEDELMTFDEFEEVTDSEGMYRSVKKIPRPTREVFAAYGVEDETDNEIQDEYEDDDNMNGSNEYLASWQQAPANVSSKSESHNPQPRPPQPMSKSQIMGSVEQGHGSTLNSVADQDYDSDETDLGELNLDEWKNVRNARGGTEESSGGDYLPDDLWHD